VSVLLLSVLVKEEEPLTRRMLAAKLCVTVQNSLTSKYATVFLFTSTNTIRIKSIQ